MTAEHSHDHDHEEKVDKTDNFSVAVTLNAEGDQANALVFRKPVAGESFKPGEIAIVAKDGSTFAVFNSEGELPYRERTDGPDEDLGLTWQFKK